MAKTSQVLPQPNISYHIKRGNTYSFRKLKSFYDSIRRAKFVEVKIKVTYGPGLFNESVYLGSYAEVRQFVQECTEKPLLEHIAGGSW